ncbi:MAG: DUF167 domain-containing protein [Bdellovibrionales bacterium]
MKISIFVKPRSKKEAVEEQPDGTFVVRVNALPTNGQANKRAVELLAKHFNTPKSTVQLSSGGKSKHKIFEILN